MKKIDAENDINQQSRSNTKIAGLRANIISVLENQSRFDIELFLRTHITSREDELAFDEHIPFDIYGEALKKNSNLDPRSRDIFHIRRRPFKDIVANYYYKDIVEAWQEIWIEDKLSHQEFCNLLDQKNHLTPSEIQQLNKRFLILNNIVQGNINLGEIETEFALWRITEWIQGTLLLTDKEYISEKSVRIENREDRTEIFVTLMQFAVDSTVMHMSHKAKFHLDRLILALRAVNTKLINRPDVKYSYLLQLILLAGNPQNDPLISVSVQEYIKLIKNETKSTYAQKLIDLITAVYKNIKPAIENKLAIYNPIAPYFIKFITSVSFKEPSTASTSESVSSATVLANHAPPPERQLDAKELIPLPGEYLNDILINQSAQCHRALSLNPNNEQSHDRLTEFMSYIKENAPHSDKPLWQIKLISEIAYNLSILFLNYKDDTSTYFKTWAFGDKTFKYPIKTNLDFAIEYLFIAFQHGNNAAQEKIDELIKPETVLHHNLLADHVADTLSLENLKFLLELIAKVETFIPDANTALSKYKILSREAPKQLRENPDQILNLLITENIGDQIYSDNSLKEILLLLFKNREYEAEVIKVLSERSLINSDISQNWSRLITLTGYVAENSAKLKKPTWQKNLIASISYIVGLTYLDYFINSEHKIPKEVQTEETRATLEYFINSEHKIPEKEQTKYISNLRSKKISMPIIPGTKGPNIYQEDILDFKTNDKKDKSSAEYGELAVEYFLIAAQHGSDSAKKKIEELTSQETVPPIVALLSQNITPSENIVKKILSKKNKWDNSYSDFLWQLLDKDYPLMPNDIVSIYGHLLYTHYQRLTKISQRNITYARAWLFTIITNYHLLIQKYQNIYDGKNIIQYQFSAGKNIISDDTKLRSTISPISTTDVVKILTYLCQMNDGIDDFDSKKIIFLLNQFHDHKGGKDIWEDKEVPNLIWGINLSDLFGIDAIKTRLLEIPKVKIHIYTRQTMFRYLSKDEADLALTSLDKGELKVLTPLQSLELILKSAELHPMIFKKHYPNYTSEYLFKLYLNLYLKLKNSSRILSPTECEFLLVMVMNQDSIRYNLMRGLSDPIDKQIKAILSIVHNYGWQKTFLIDYFLKPFDHYEHSFIETLKSFVKSMVEDKSDNLDDMQKIRTLLNTPILTFLNHVSPKCIQDLLARCTDNLQLSKYISQTYSHPKRTVFAIEYIYNHLKELYESPANQELNLPRAIFMRFISSQEGDITFQTWAMTNCYSLLIKVASESADNLSEFLANLLVINKQIVLDPQQTTSLVQSIELALSSPNTSQSQKIKSHLLPRKSLYDFDWADNWDHNESNNDSVIPVNNDTCTGLSAANDNSVSSVNVAPLQDNSANTSSAVFYASTMNSGETRMTAHYHAHHQLSSTYEITSSPKYANKEGNSHEEFSNDASSPNLNIGLTTLDKPSERDSASESFGSQSDYASRSNNDSVSQKNVSGSLDALTSAQVSEGEASEGDDLSVGSNVQSDNRNNFSRAYYDFNPTDDESESSHAQSDNTNQFSKAYYTFNHESSEDTYSRSIQAFGDDEDNYDDAYSDPENDDSYVDSAAHSSENSESTNSTDLGSDNLGNSSDKSSEEDQVSESSHSKSGNAMSRSSSGSGIQSELSQDIYSQSSQASVHSSKGNDDALVSGAPQTDSHNNDATPSHVCAKEEDKGFNASNSDAKASDHLNTPPLSHEQMHSPNLGLNPSNNPKDKSSDMAESSQTQPDNSSSSNDSVSTNSSESSNTSTSIQDSSHTESEASQDDDSNESDSSDSESDESKTSTTSVLDKLITYLPLTSFIEFSKSKTLVALATNAFMDCPPTDRIRGSYLLLQSVDTLNTKQKESVVDNMMDILVGYNDKSEKTIQDNSTIQEICQLFNSHIMAKLMNAKANLIRKILSNSYYALIARNPSELLTLFEKKLADRRFIDYLDTYITEDETCNIIFLQAFSNLLKLTIDNLTDATLKMTLNSRYDKIFSEVIPKLLINPGLPNRICLWVKNHQKDKVQLALVSADNAIALLKSPYIQNLIYPDPRSLIKIIDKFIDDNTFIMFLVDKTQKHFAPSASLIDFLATHLDADYIKEIANHNKVKIALKTTLFTTYKSRLNDIIKSHINKIRAEIVTAKTNKNPFIFWTCNIEIADKKCKALEAVKKSLGPITSVTSLDSMIEECLSNSELTANHNPGLGIAPNSLIQQLRSLQALITNENIAFDVVDHKLELKVFHR